MRTILTAAVALLLAGFAADGAKADQYKADEYRWCAQNIGGDGSSNCYFTTLEQCQAAVSGAGAYCTPNSFATQSEAAGAYASKKRK